MRRTLLSLILFSLVAFACGCATSSETPPAKIDETPNQAETTQTPPDFAKQAEIVADAYLKSLTQGNYDEAQTYIWPYSESFMQYEEGTYTAAIQQQNENLGRAGEYYNLALNVIEENYAVFDATIAYTGDDEGDTFLLTIVNASGTPQVSVNNLLCGFVGMDAAATQGISAYVSRAGVCVDGYAFDIVVCNKLEEAIALGQQDGDDAEVQLTTSVPGTVNDLGMVEGGGPYDTLIGYTQIPAGERATLDIQLENIIGDIRSLSLMGVLIGDEEILLDVSMPPLAPLAGGLEINNPFTE